MTMNHCSSGELNGYLDKRLPGPEMDAVKQHLLVCPQCMSALESFERLDASLRRVPNARMSDGFTESVLSRLHLASKSPLAFRLLEKVAYLFGLFIVLAIMLTAFVVTGAVEISTVAQTQGVLQKSVAAMGESVDEGVKMFTTTLKTYFPFAFGKGAVSIAVFGSLILGLLGLVDRVVVRRFVHRA